MNVGLDLGYLLIATLYKRNHLFKIIILIHTDMRLWLRLTH